MADRAHLPGPQPPARRRVLAIVAAAAIVVGACGGDGGVSLESELEGAPPVVPAVTSPAADPAPDVAIPTDLALRLTPIMEASKPVAMATHPQTGAVYLAEKDGIVSEVDLAAGTKVQELLDIEGGLADSFQEQGLLGLAWSPDGDFLYVNFSDGNGDTVIAEYPFDGSALAVDAGREVLRVSQPAVNHNGGDLKFGPDGFLYIALGDGGGSNDEFGNGQDPDTLLGTIARIDPRPNEGASYAVPADNPFADRGGRPEIYLWGARNPWRFAFDRLTGDLWVADVGQDALEEVNALYVSDGAGRGVNLGWPNVEGTAPFAASSPPAEDYAAPIYEYTHDEGCSVTGGYVYRGTSIPDLQGHYVFGDFCTSVLWGLATSQQQGVLGRFDLGLALPEGTLVSFFEDDAGELYVLGFDDTISRIDPA